jgi:hypothetical protein
MVVFEVLIFSGVLAGLQMFQKRLITEVQLTL